MVIENLLVPPLSEKPSQQRPLTRKELDIVYHWLDLLFQFFNARGDSGEQLGVPAETLKSPKWHELASLNFFYFEDTNSLIRESERMAAATAQRAQQSLQQQNSVQQNRLSAPPDLWCNIWWCWGFCKHGHNSSWKEHHDEPQLGHYAQSGRQVGVANQGFRTQQFGRANVFGRMIE